MLHRYTQETARDPASRVERFKGWLRMMRYECTGHISEAQQYAGLGLLHDRALPDFQPEAVGQVVETQARSDGLMQRMRNNAGRLAAAALLAVASLPVGIVTAEAAVNTVNNVAKGAAGVVEVNNEGNRTDNFCEAYRAGVGLVIANAQRAAYDTAHPNAVLVEGTNGLAPAPDPADVNVFPVNLKTVVCPVG